MVDLATRRFSLRDLFVLTTVCGVLCLFVVPAILAAREQSRRNACAGKLKEIGLGLQMHHDTFKLFPPVSYQGHPDGEANVGLMPGSGSSGTSAGFRQHPGTASGYSWIVRILPYLGEQELYFKIVAASRDFTLEAWGNSAQFQTDVGGIRRHYATVALDPLSCPSYRGPQISTACSGAANIRVAGYSLPATAYGPFFDAGASPPRGVQITNYVALSATTSLHMPDRKTADGVIIPGTGLNMKRILDGTSRTLMICETREPAFNIWYDGTTAWTTATPAGTQLIRGDTHPTMGFLFVPPGEVSALDCGPYCLRSDGTPRLYAPAGYTTAGFAGQSGSIAYGPSSDHSGSLVMHAAADASVHSISTDIDPTLYVRLVTRDGGEPVGACCDDQAEQAR